MAELDPGAFLKGFAGMQNSFDAMADNRIKQLAMQDKMQERQQTNALNELYRGAVDENGNINRQKILSGAASGGLGAQIPGLQKTFNEQDKASSETAISQIKAAKTKNELIGQISGSILNLPPESQQSAYEQGKALLQSQGVDTSGMAAQYDPVKGKQAFMQSIDSAKQLDNHMKMLEFGLKKDAFGYRQQNDAANRGVTMRGQDVTRLGQIEAGDRAAGKESGSDKKLQAAQAQKAVDAKEVLAILDQAEPLLKKSTASLAGAGLDKGLGFLGISTDGAQAAAQLKALEGALISKMPKMTGPQSDKDVLLYRQMAGQIADSSLPVATRMAALNTVRTLNQKQLGSVSQSPVTEQNNATAVRKIAFNGKQAEARRAPDGKYYIQQPNGKWARVDD